MFSAMCFTLELTRDPTDPILDTGFLNVPHSGPHAQGKSGILQITRACHIMEAKLMKYHVLPRELAKFC